MTDDTRITALLDELVESFEGEDGDWGDVLDRAAPRPVRRQRRVRLLLSAAAVLAAAVTLTVVSPWSSRVSVVDRAAAAILAPRPGSVLFERITLRLAGTFVPRHAVVVPIRVWVDGSRPQRFRMTVVNPLPGDGPVEVGGLVGAVNGLTWDRAGKTLDAAAFGAPATPAALDPAAYAKLALQSGRAKVDGTVTIKGARALRIRVGSPDAGTAAPLAVLFVDPHTYRPLRVEIDAAAPVPEHASLPLTCVSQLFPFTCDVSLPRNTWVYDFEEYRYLAPTAANRKLADIRAMHPGAEVV